ncbi:CRISPR-associated helicase Cas3', partial [bacterium]|nr:CRISPR-associated helicase Cas3' [candidate division CSSED10-310 bacterium]
YQTVLAESEHLPDFLNIPTGLGKTAAIVMTWLWRRRFTSNLAIREKTPRRLIYCLPMRVLVSQTKKCVEFWLERLDLYNDYSVDGISVNVLMGGQKSIKVNDLDWDAHPENDMIIIGTQDQLLSRALNRGYSMSRYRWPVHFALLNNDAFWVFDEIQLMSSGLATSLQLEAFRKLHKPAVSCHSLWMSATIRKESLQTVDSENPDKKLWLSLSRSDNQIQTVTDKTRAAKPIIHAKTALTKENKNEYAKLASSEILEYCRNINRSFLIVVVNRVQRAVDIYKQLKKQIHNDGPEIYLIHSRFRPSERIFVEQKLNESPSEKGCVFISTQVVEAGVDIDAKILFTELAPWPSLVQRFGRCNRKGRYKSEETLVVWLDVDTSVDEYTLPYNSDQMNIARNVLNRLNGVDLETLSTTEVHYLEETTTVIRHKDLIDLFDTTPSLSGMDIDISRFIRDSDTLDIQVYWRNWDEWNKEGASQPPSQDIPAPDPEELCPVPVNIFSRWFSSKSKKLKNFAYVWDSLDRNWHSLNLQTIVPGKIILLHCEAGGYSEELGWSGDSTSVKPVATKIQFPLTESMNVDYRSVSRKWQTITDHTNDVIVSMVKLKDQLHSKTVQFPWDQLMIACRWHDLGKAHPAFQNMLKDVSSPPSENMWAKSDSINTRPDYWIKEGESKKIRRHFRHELASALAMMQSGLNDLPVYLVASHHGKIRMSIRSLPDEPVPDDGRRFARGVYEGDRLPEVYLGDKIKSLPIVLKLDVMEMGLGESGESWLQRMINLLNYFGPFALAYMEMLVRVADWRGSARIGDDK